MSNGIKSFGDARLLLVETIVSLKSGEMDVSRGMAIAANMKVLNDNVQAEINAAKLALKAAETGRNFGDVMEMGKTCLVSTPLIEG
jgi:hypothetical protein